MNMKKKFIILTLALIPLLMLCTACKKTPERPPFLPPPTFEPPPDMIWDVRTDYSNLTPYVPPHLKHTRLHPGPLPELIPSYEYGMLLPYTSAVTMTNGTIRESKLGLVTIDGTVVTDLVYERIERARNYVYATQKFNGLPAYILSENIPGTESPWGAQLRHAVCALDGSWVTSFEFEDVMFTDEFMLMVRSYESLDVDVCGYDGRIMYNFLETDWIGKVPKDVWIASMIYSASEGYSAVQMQDGTYALIDLMTGAATLTEYTAVLSFSEGLAAVMVRMQNFGEHPELWGYINREFRLVIPPRYTQATLFRNGRAVVETTDGTQRVINTRGETLFSAPSSYIDMNYDIMGFTVWPLTGDRQEKHYSNDFVEIKLPSDALISGQHTSIQYRGAGWYSYETGEGAWFFTSDEAHYIPGIEGGFIEGGEYLVYTWSDKTEHGFGAMTLGGREIIPREKDINITAATKSGKVLAYVVNSNEFWYYIRSEYRPSVYRLVGRDGSVLASGPGILRYDEAAELYSVMGPDYFAWLDLSGKTIISIPLMSYTLD